MEIKSTQQMADEMVAALSSGTIEEIAAKVGVEIRLEGARTYVYHCGRAMRVGSGICGADVIECKACGLVVARIDSPHTNGGYVYTPEAIDAFADRVWTVTSQAREVK